MTSQNRPRLTYANVMATIAVLLALGGGSFAVASHLTVRASDIKRNAVRAKHIKRKQVKAAELTKVVARDKIVQVAPEQGAEARARCRRGEDVISGGATWGVGLTATDLAALRLVDSERAGRGWRARGFNGYPAATGEPFPFRVFAYCLRR